MGSVLTTGESSSSDEVRGGMRALERKTDILQKEPKAVLGKSQGLGE